MGSASTIKEKIKGLYLRLEENLEITGQSGPVAQGIEQQPSKLWAIGSNPIGVTLSD